MGWSARLLNSCATACLRRTWQPRQNSVHWLPPRSPSPSITAWKIQSPAPALSSKISVLLQTSTLMYKLMETTTLVQTRVYVRSGLMRNPVASFHYAMPISQNPGTRWSLCMPGLSNLRPVRGPNSWNGSPRMIVLYLRRRRHKRGLPTAPCQVVEPGSRP